MYATPDWTALKYIKAEHASWRLYACKCECWEEATEHLVINDGDSAGDPRMPWVWHAGFRRVRHHGAKHESSPRVPASLPEDVPPEQIQLAERTAEQVAPPILQARRALAGAK